MSQIKQIMMANIDVVYVHLIERFEEQRINFFAALSELRSLGYDVPKIAPFLDPFGIWALKEARLDVAKKGGKDEFVGQYLRFFEQYFAVNTDALAETYLAQIDGRLVLVTWWVYTILQNQDALSRRDIEERLMQALGDRRPAFRRGTYIVTTALIDPDLSFSDERAVFFSGYTYCIQSVHNGIYVHHLQPGYWDQNLRRPGYHMPRHGGRPYKAAWDYVLYQCMPHVHRIYIESWNEYDEGSGIYAADPNGPLIMSAEARQRDCWSDNNDSFEYIRTTAAGASVFNRRPQYDARILYHAFPKVVRCGERAEAVVVVQNRGNIAWKRSDDISFGVKGAGADFGKPQYPVSDADVEIDPNGGIFRGAPVRFTIQLQAPPRAGRFTGTWSMLRDGNTAFGEELEISIDVLN